MVHLPNSFNLPCLHPFVPQSPLTSSVYILAPCRAEQLCSREDFQNDCIILAGDISDDLHTLHSTLQFFTQAFAHVFFTPGNHELWVRKQERDQYDSLGKLSKLLEMCEELGVRTAPAKINGVWVVPLWSWYHASWDKEPDVPGAMPIEKVMLDFHVCSWHSIPGLKASGDDSLARHFDHFNDAAGQYSAALGAITEERGRCAAQGLDPPPVISFSHFLPDQRLLPEKRWLFYPNLAKASGSEYLGRRVVQLQPHAHVYGHTHFTQDQVGFNSPTTIFVATHILAESWVL